MNQHQPRQKIDDDPVKGLNSFLASAPADQFLTQLWDMIQDTIFWIKDAEGNFVWVNEALLSQAGVTRDELIGKKDSDFFPDELAFLYMQDDAKIIADREPMLNKPELVVSEAGVVEWHQTSKFPIRNSEGEVIGTIGISKKIDANTPLPPEYASLSRFVSFVSENLSKRIQVRDIAKEAHLSISTLERYFQSHMRTTPREFLKRVRMKRATHLLALPTLNISEIAHECGYDSVSSFSRAFRAYSDMTPGQYRRSRLRYRQTPDN